MNSITLKSFREGILKEGSTISPNTFTSSLAKGQSARPRVEHLKPMKLNIKRPAMKAMSQGKAPTL